MMAGYKKKIASIASVKIYRKNLHTKKYRETSRKLLKNRSSIHHVKNKGKIFKLFTYTNNTYQE